MDYASIYPVREIRADIYTTALNALQTKYGYRFDFDVFQDAVFKFLRSETYNYTSDVKEVGFIMAAYHTTLIDVKRRDSKSVSYEAVMGILDDSLEQGKIVSLSSIVTSHQL